MANEFKVKKGLIVDGSNTVLDIQGTQGQLFSVTDVLTGDLLSVSDVSGIPILNVNSSGVIDVDAYINVDGYINLSGTTTDYYIGGSGGGEATNKLRIGSTTTTNTVALEIHHSSNPVSLGIGYNGGAGLAFIESAHSSYDVNTHMLFKPGGTETWRIGSHGTAAGSHFKIQPASSAYDFIVADAGGTSIITADSGTRGVTFAGNITATGGTLNLGNDVSIFDDGVNILRTDDAFHANNDIYIGGAGRIYDRANNATFIDLSHPNMTFTTPSGAATFTGDVAVGGATSSAAITLADHTTAAGGIKFRTAASTVSLYSSGSGNLMCAADFNSAGRIRLPGGNAVADPDIGFSGATAGTGFSRAGQDITFVAGGSEKMRLKSDGKIGLGTNDPQDKLHVYGAVRGDLKLEGNYTGGTTDVGKFSYAYKPRGGDTNNKNIAYISGYNTTTNSTSGGYIDIATRQTNSTMQHRIRIDHDGEVGINTTNPTERLEVVGNILAKDSGVLAGVGGAKDGFIFHDLYTGSGDYYGYKAYTNNSNTRLSIVTNGSERLTVLADGKVGVGHSTLYQKFTVNGNIDVRGGNGCLLTFNNGDGGIGIHYNNADSVDGRDLAFKTYKHGVGNTEKMRINRDGNVGINTSSPASMLEVHGGGSGVNDVDRYVRFKSSNDEKRFDFYIGGTGNGSRLSMFDHDGTTEGVRLQGGGGNNHILGNLGIGVSSPTTALQVGGLDDGSNYDITVGWNAVSSESVGTKRSALTFKTNQTGVNNEDIYKWDIAMVTAPATASSEPFGSDLAFLRSTRNSTSVNETTLKLTQLGQVGVGDASPTIISANTSSLSVNSSRNDLSGGLITKANGAVKHQQYWDSSGYSFNLSANAGDFKWNVNGNNRMLVDKDGGLDIQGTVGQLFSVTNSLTGDLFSVSDISGIPILNVNSSGAIAIDGYIHGQLKISGDGSNAATFTESGSGDFEIHAQDDLRLNTGGHDIVLKGASNEFGRLTNSSQDFVIRNTVSDKDIIFKGNDGGSEITALTLDMSEGGKATFAGKIIPNAHIELPYGGELRTLDSGGGVRTIARASSNKLQYGWSYGGAVEFMGGGSYTPRITINTDGSTKFSSNVSLAQTKKLLFDGQMGHTYITEESDSNLKFYVGGTEALNVSNSGSHFTSGVYIPDYIHHVNDSGTKFGFSANDTFVVRNAGAVKLTVASNGDTTATGKIIAKSNTGVGDIYLGNNHVNNYVRFHTNNSNTYFDMNCGVVYWRQGSNTRFQHNMTSGTFTSSGDIIAYGSPSDVRLKENIKPIESALAKVDKLQGVTFDWKDSESILEIKEDIGFIAQDVQKVLPELVRENENGMLSMRHQGITPILLEAIKELKAEIEELKKQIK